MVFLGGLGHLLKSAISNSPWLFCGILFIEGLNWRTFFIAHSQHFATFCWPVWLTLYLLEGGERGNEGGNGGHVLSSRDSRICLYSQILNLRFFPAICSLCSVQIFQFLFVCLSLFQSYMPHNTYTYVFLFFVSSHVCLIFPTQKTEFFFSSARHSLLRSFHIFIVIQLGFFHVTAVVFSQMFAQLLADNKRKRATTITRKTTYKKGVYFVRPHSSFPVFCSANWNSKRIRKAITQKLNICWSYNFSRRLWLLGKVYSTLK